MWVPLTEEVVRALTLQLYDRVIIHLMLIVVLGVLVVHHRCLLVGATTSVTTRGLHNALAELKGTS